MKAVIVTGRGAQDQELIYPQYRLAEAGYDVQIAARQKVPFQSIGGIWFAPTMDFEALWGTVFDLLVIPGGVKAMEHLRLEEDTVDFIREFPRPGRVIASICSGAQLLISAGLCEGRRIAAYPAMRVDVENAGGTFVNDVCSHGGIVTAPHYRDLGRWMAATLEEVKRARI